MTQPLSPDTQVVRDAFTGNDTIYGLHLMLPRLAAALRAVADRSENLYDSHEGKVSVIRTDLALAIAAELEGHP